MGELNQGRPSLWSTPLWKSISKSSFRLKKRVQVGYILHFIWPRVESLYFFASSAFLKKDPTQLNVEEGNQVLLFRLPIPSINTEDSSQCLALISANAFSLGSNEKFTKIYGRQPGKLGGSTFLKWRAINEQERGSAYGSSFRRLPRENDQKARI